MSGELVGTNIGTFLQNIGTIVGTSGLSIFGLAALVERTAVAPPADANRPPDGASVGQQANYSFCPRSVSPHAPSCTIEHGWQRHSRAIDSMTPGSRFWPAKLFSVDVPLGVSDGAAEAGAETELLGRRPACYSANESTVNLTILPKLSPPARCSGTTRPLCADAAGRRIFLAPIADWAVAVQRSR